MTLQAGDIMVLNTTTTTNEYTNGGGSHTTTIETFNDYVATTIEGNFGQRVTSTSHDFKTSDDVNKILFIARIGTEFFPQDEENQVEGEGEAEAVQEPVSSEELLDPLREMASRLQLLAHHKEYIETEVLGASVNDMLEEEAEGGTQ